MHENGKLLFLKYAREQIKDNMRVLEIGPDAFPSTLRSLVDADVTWETLDIYEDDRLTYSNANGYEFPIKEGVYDVVLSAQVIEHVPRVWDWVCEIGRVCRPGGCVITINPVSWPYHEAPIDCWRVYPEGMRALYERANIDVEFSVWESLEKVNSKRRTPGRSTQTHTRLRRAVYALLGPIGFPVECAYDTVTIGVKR